VLEVNSLIRRTCRFQVHILVSPGLWSDPPTSAHWECRVRSGPHLVRPPNRSHTGHMQTRQLTAEILDAAIEGFEARKLRIDEQIAQVRQLLNGDRPVAASAPELQKQPRAKLSAATRKRMGEAQRKRWATTSEAETKSKATARPKRKLSATGRAAIVAALKKRWAAKKAGLTVVKKAVGNKAAPRKAAAKKATANGKAAA
jgi:hypothetical protein